MHQGVDEMWVRQVIGLFTLLVTLGLPVLVSAEQQPPPPPVYRVQPDQRMCFYPLCGGSVVRQVNRLTTVCANGEEAEACYVPRIEYDVLGMDSEQVAAFERTLYAG